jgi:hypothetical protein
VAKLEKLVDAKLEAEDPEKFVANAPYRDAQWRAAWFQA